MDIELINATLSFIISLCQLVLMGGVAFGAYKLVQRVWDSKETDVPYNPMLDKTPKGPLNHELPEDGVGRTGEIIKV